MVNCTMRCETTFGIAIEMFVAITRGGSAEEASSNATGDFVGMEVTGVVVKLLLMLFGIA